MVSPDMRTLKLTLAYDGTDFAGWQVQQGKRTVQGVLETAWAEITGETLRATASGRTDAGVHALAQVASLKSGTHLTTEVLQRALNASLPGDVVVLSVEEAEADFHAIRDAVSKRYRYVIHDGELADVFRRRYSWKVWQRLDERAMHRAAQALVGTHDFQSFQTSGAPRKTTVRTVSDLWVRRGSGDEADLVTCEIEADGFLYNMVRAIVGTLHEVGRGAQSENWPREVLAARDRRAGAMTAPPQGLLMVRVRYDAPDRRA
jgi:tRNA pseudouridine38-40 synthase